MGRGSNLLESMRLVYDNILDRPDSLDHLKKLQRLGVINSQAELKELQSLISKGFGYTDDATVEGLPTARRFGSKLTDNSVGKFIRNIGKKAEDLYQGGDDIWKIYNFEFEKTNLEMLWVRCHQIKRLLFTKKNRLTFCRSKSNR